MKKKTTNIVNFVILLIILANIVDRNEMPHLLKSLFIPLDLHRHVDKLSMECTFCILPLSNEVYGDTLV